MTPHDEMLDNVAAYALGVLRSGEAAIVVEHMRACELCDAEYRRLRSAVTAVAYSAEACANAATGATAASPLLKARLMKQIRSAAARPPRPAAPWAWTAAAACLLAAIAAGAIDLSLNARVGEDRARIAQQGVTIADLTASSSRHFAFRNGEIITNGPRLYIAVRSLPAPPAGRVYQAWTLARGARSVAPSVTFKPDNGGAAVVPLPVDARSIAAVAVSVEPDGGSRQPTTKPIALVKIGQ
ncbi:MAG TPA: anti-sigma factor [Candidatus Tyrphobacter sp.]